MTTGEKIKKLRTAKKITQSELAEAVGTTKQNIYKYETGIISNIPPDRVEAIAKFFEVSPAYLMGWDTPNFSQHLKRARLLIYKKSLKELSESSGISEKRLVEFECNFSEPTMEELTAIAQTYGLSLGEFLWNDVNDAASEASNFSPLPQDKIRMIPIYESVSAGFGAYADNYITGYTPCYIVNDQEAANTLCITVEGDSMYPKIENGDLVQVVRQDWAENGQIAVVLVDGENGLVKKFEQDKHSVTLISINPEYPPKVFEGLERSRVQVLGVVKKIIKSV